MVKDGDEAGAGSDHTGRGALGGLFLMQWWWRPTVPTGMKRLRAM